VGRKLWQFEDRRDWWISQRDRLATIRHAHTFARVCWWEADGLFLCLNALQIGAVVVRRCYVHVCVHVDASVGSESVRVF
jgi:hypothetical protein